MVLLSLPLLLFPLAAFSSVLPAPAAPPPARRDVSPDTTCGLVEAGAGMGYTCPEDAACCSQHGYCGADDTYCLTTAGCQADYSNSTGACREPEPDVSLSIDGTCGIQGAGEHGYRCPGSSTVASCCSAEGYCGDTAEHCDIGSGCQPEYGNCN